MTGPVKVVVPLLERRRRRVPAAPPMTELMGDERSVTATGERVWLEEELPPVAVPPLVVVPPATVPVSAAAVARSAIRTLALGVPRPVTRS